MPLKKGRGKKTIRSNIKELKELLQQAVDKKEGAQKETADISSEFISVIKDFDITVNKVVDTNERTHDALQKLVAGYTEMKNMLTSLRG